MTIWKRPTPTSEIAPIDNQDGVDFIVVSVADEKNCGQFVFAKQILISKGIMSNNSKGGKRAIRVYPPWTKPVAKDAIKTQQWQLLHFLPMPIEKTVDLERVHMLYIHK